MTVGFMGVLGRPYEFSDDVRKMAEGLLRSGMSYRKVAIQCGLSLGQVQRVVRDMTSGGER